MTKKEYNLIYNYLANNCEEVAAYFEKCDNNFTGKFNITSGCKLSSLNTIFGTSIKCQQYDTVANGEGNEEEKIDTVYSSSLQSLLVFHNVNENNKIIIGDEKFDKVIFEYKNKVIGYPSSVDVVLMNDHAIAFIESKYLEIVRDSNNCGKKVVGISYFGQNENGYNGIGLTKEELDEMKIEYNYPKSSDNISDEQPYLKCVKGLSKYSQSIGKIEDADYVYSEGIKQILSHVIGINSFKNGESGYSNRDKDPISEHNKFRKIFYVELYNGLPGLNFASKRIEDFRRHANIVKGIIEKKNIVDEFIVMSYQDLYSNNDKFNFADKVKRYYQLEATN